MPHPELAHLNMYDLRYTFVPVPLRKLVIGLGNAWVDGVKSVNITAASVGQAYSKVSALFRTKFSAPTSS